MVKINFYPYDFEYKIKEEFISGSTEKKTYLYIYSLLEDGTKICITYNYQPFFYLSVDDLGQEEKDKLKEILLQIKVDVEGMFGTVARYEEVKLSFLGKEKNFWKIYTQFPKAVPLLSKELDQLGLITYEKDVLFVHRFLRDLQITPNALVEAEGNFADDRLMRIPVFKASTLKQISKEISTKQKILAIDIETYAKEKIVDPENNPILMVAFSGDDSLGGEGKGKTFRKVITWKHFKHNLDYVETVQTEADLLARFREVILELQPEIITGYFSDGFDFPYIKARADKFRIKMDLGLDRSGISAGKKASFRDGETKISGLVHLDVFKFIRNIFGKNLKTDSYSLDAVSYELLGHKKHDVRIEHLWKAWDHDNESLEEFCRYNLHDADLTLKLCQRLLPEILAFCKILSLPSFDVIRMRSSRLIESYIMKRAVEFKVIAPNKPGDYELQKRMEESIEGAFVYEPEPGLYQDIVVFDFRSLYPTIITAHNLGPESFKKEGCKNIVYVPGLEKYWFCSDKKEFMPTVLEELILIRTDLKKIIKNAGITEKPMLEARSNALKLLANSFYGYLGFYGARWYSLPSAASTTAYARDYIKSVIEKGKTEGFKVIYGDTDSCFFELGKKSLEEAKQFMHDINLTLPGHMELEFEGYFPRGIFVAQKGSEKGAKKRYALMSEEGKMKITGFETVRRNTSPIAKEVQEEVLHLVLSGEVDMAVKYVKEVIKNVLANKYDIGKFVIKTQITRNLESYNAIGPHVAVARKMREKGYPIVPGTTIEYVISKGSGLTRDRAVMVEEAENYDPEYYINNQIIPAVGSILAVFNVDEDELLSKGQQKGLKDFFG